MPEFRHPHMTNVTFAGPKFATSVIDLVARPRRLVLMDGSVQHRHLMQHIPF